MADQDDELPQDDTPEPEQRLFTLTEAERARRELEPFLVEAMECRKKLSGLDNDLSAVAARIMMMGGVIVPYEALAKLRRENPGIRVIAHPECKFEVVEAADEIGSTEGIIRVIKAAPPGSQWAVGTEIHMVNRLSKELKDRQVMSLDPSVCVCTTMFRITPVHLLWALENLGAGNIVNQISVDERTRKFARTALDRMLSLR